MLGINSGSPLPQGALHDSTWMVGVWTFEPLGARWLHQLCLPSRLANDPETRALLSALGMRAFRTGEEVTLELDLRGERLGPWKMSIAGRSHRSTRGEVWGVRPQQQKVTLSFP